MPVSHYNKGHKLFSRSLRNNSTDGEIILWKEVLSQRKMHGFQFNRQYPIDKFIVDFICRSLKLIIEVDGYSHKFKIKKDKIRDRHLQDLGYKMIRIDEYDIKKNLNEVIRSIEAVVLDLRDSSVRL